jgi:dTDP-4-amino-4,6-dideoxygalactose transaminase
VLEDSCQALGSERDGLKAGSWGKAGAFSFFPAKILGAYGDAGALTTNDEALYKELKDMREHYKYNPGKYGFNSRLDELQAAILNVKLKYLPEMIKRRQEVADIYDQELKDLPIVLPTKRPGRVYQDYIIRTNNRDELAQFLKDNGIETLKNDYHFPDDLPKPEDTVELEKQTLRIPCNDVLTDEEVRYVCQKITEFYKK